MRRGGPSPRMTCRFCLKDVAKVRGISERAHLCPHGRHCPRAGERCPECVASIERIARFQLATIRDQLDAELADTVPGAETETRRRVFEAVTEALAGDGRRLSASYLDLAVRPAIRLGTDDQRKAALALLRAAAAFVSRDFAGAVRTVRTALPHLRPLPAKGSTDAPRPRRRTG